MIVSPFSYIGFKPFLIFPGTLLMLQSVMLFEVTLSLNWAKFVYVRYWTFSLV